MFYGAMLIVGPNIGKSHCRNEKIYFTPTNVKFYSNGLRVQEGKDSCMYMYLSPNRQFVF